MTFAPSDDPQAAAWPAGDVPPEIARRIAVPRRFVGAIERNFLIDRIRHGIAGQIVLLRAPAGFGKTELLADAFTRLREPGDRFAWLTIAEADSDPGVLVRAIGAAFGIQLDGGSDAEAGLHALLARIAASPARHVLMLDMLQAAFGDAFSQCFATFLRHLPDNLRLVIGTSRRPEVPLSRFRLRGFLTELTASDLAFSRTEMKRMVGKRLSQAELDEFAELTGGWPALVQLAAPLFDAATDKGARSAIAAGLHRSFSDFLLEEVAPELPGDLRAVLDVCSILSEFPLELASHLAGVAVAPRSSRDFEDIAPIILPVDQRPGWFRLHPAVRATFLAEIDERSPESIAALHSSAASWFASHGHLEKAVTHASRAGEYTLAAEAILKAGGVNLFILAGHTVLERLIDNIPAADIYRSPSLKLCYSLVLAKRGRVQSAREIILDLKRSLEGDPAALPALDFDHIEGMVDIYEDCHLDTGPIDALESKVARLGPKETWDRGWIYNHLCIAYTRQGDLALARNAALKSLACYREEGTAYAQIFMLTHMALVAMLEGRPSAAILSAREAEALAQRTQWSDDNLLAIVHIPLAEALYQQGDVKVAEAMLREGIPYLARGEGWVDLFQRGYGTLARAQMGANGIEAALALLDRADEVAIERELPRLRLSADLLRIELLTRAGLIESAMHLAATLPSLDDVAAWPTWREWSDASVALARLAARTDRPDEAIRDIEVLLADAERNDRGFHLLVGSVVAIEANWAAGRQEAALSALQRAIALARPQDWLQVFLDEGQPLSQAVRAIVRRFGLSTFSPKTAEFVGRIAGAFHQVQTDQAGAGHGLLSTREAEILDFLSRGATNKEIARDLGLTEATVKFHLKNINAKLGVGRRSLAVSVARRMGLLGVDPAADRRL